MITKQIQRKVLEWLANGQTGVSSETMAFWLAFAIKRDRADHPHDPADLNRCLLLLECVPELRSYLFRMGRLSPVWKHLVAEWEGIESTFLEEAGLNWSKGRDLHAKKTYALMKDVIAR